MIADTTYRARAGETIRIWVMSRTSASAGVTGATVAIGIRRDVDNYWWDGANRVFVSAATTQNMTEADATNLAGLYYYDFRPGITDFSAVFYATTAAATSVNDPFVGDIVVGGWVDDVDIASSTLATAANLDSLMSRIGTTFVDADLAKLSGLVRMLSADQKKALTDLNKRIDNLSALIK